jgi:riboflavin-specific deaminase-like protein
MHFRRLTPDPAQVDLDGLLAELRDELADRAPAGRPYTIANFIASADGRATLAGRSGPLGDDGDRAMFHGLREQVDAVLVGTGTLRAERYGRIIGNAARRERRVARGASPEPLACVITRSGQLSAEIPMFDVPEATIVVFTSAQLDLSSHAAHIDVIRLDSAELTLTAALRRLREGYGVRLLLCEGGPTLFGGLLHERLVDELFLTTAPKLAGGGTSPTIASGAELAQPQGLALNWLLERHASLYARYTIG